MAKQLKSLPPKGKHLKVHCVDIDRHGRGVARWNTWVVIVPGLLPGEVGIAEVLTRQRSQIISKLKGQFT